MARLGAEAGDALDAFLNAALDHERRYGPSLAGFLQHVTGSAADVKRDLSASAGEVRVMTVHGSKGLEAKIVILADLGIEPGAKRLPKILAAPAQRAGLVPIWLPASAEDTQATAAAKAKVVAQMVEGASPPALCRHDPRRGPADRLRRPGQGRGPEWELGRDDRGRSGTVRSRGRRDRRRRGRDPAASP
ncbi:hypothetical protein [Bosea thiooxidans]